MTRSRKRYIQFCTFIEIALCVKVAASWTLSCRVQDAARYCSFAYLFTQERRWSAAPGTCSVPVKLGGSFPGDCAHGMHVQCHTRSLVTFTSILEVSPVSSLCFPFFLYRPVFPVFSRVLPCSLCFSVFSVFYRVSWFLRSSF